MLSGPGRADTMGRLVGGPGNVGRASTGRNGPIRETRVSKHVLMIGRAYPPLNASGAHRPAKLAKYLPAFGWTPVVLCAGWTPENSWGGFYDPLLAARPDVCRTVRVPYPARPSSLVGRATDQLLPMVFPYRAPFGFTRRLLAAAEALVRRETFDALWSTYKPGLSHYVASRIARRHGVPWVADFRDIADQYDLGVWRFRHEVRQEVLACRWASAVATVSRPLADRLAARYPVPVYVIPNGFDPDDFPPAPDGPLATFTISYFGAVYGERNPRPLFEAIDRLAASNQVRFEDVQIRFYGSRADHVERMAQPYECRRIVECLPRLPHGEMVRAQQQSAVLLLLSHRTFPGLVTGKVFDYLGAGRPILDVPGGGVTGELLDETRAGIGVGDPQEIAQVVHQWYEEWKATGTVAWRGVPRRIAAYSRKEQAGRLAQVFDSLCGRG